MHRTTISLDRPVEKELRQLAAKERRSFKELVNDLLRRGLKTYRGESPARGRFSWHTAAGAAQPFFNPADRQSYAEQLVRNFP